MENKKEVKNKKEINLKEFDFMKDMLRLLKENNLNYEKSIDMHIKHFATSSEISRLTYDVIINSITLGKSLNSELSNENLEIIKHFINIGIEIENHKEAKRLMEELSKDSHIEEKKYFSDFFQK